MKTRLTLLACGAAALTLAACNNQENPGQSDPVNAAQDATSEAVGSVSAMTAGQTVDGYVMNAAMGDMYEIQDRPARGIRDQPPMPKTMPPSSLAPVVVPSVELVLITPARAV